MGIQGSSLEKLLWDIAIIEGEDKVQARPKGVITGKKADQMLAGAKVSVGERIRRKRQLMGIV